MRITELVLSNFRCFGPTPTTVTLAGLTALVGTNAAGKSTILYALQRMFGRSSADRELVPDDFHVAPVPSTTPVVERKLSIEAKLEFPELLDATANQDAVAECFRQMVVTETGQSPYCRIRLEGVWTAGGVPEGLVEQHLVWIKASESESEKKSEVRAADRARIHVHYVPAARDPLKQIRHASGSLIGRLLTAVNWSEAVKTEVTVASGEIQTAFGKESGIASIQDALSENWRTVHDGSVYGGVAIRPIGKRFEDVLRNIEAVFSPSPGSTEDPLERLSDGQRSLFYLAMVGAIFDIEEHVLASDAVGAHFDGDRMAPPSLTIIALEEPENHIAPHYLGRIMDLLRRIAGTLRAQVVLTSHSTSIMHRVEPTEVRHVRLDPASRASLVRSIALPAETDEAYKFIREAVRAFPELYFARFVILGEGDSEEIVLPRISEALGVRVDQSFVSVVPLGGRHVNHFWRLLHSLNIPYVTLLDFDLEREGGGWGRIKYALNQLIAVGTPKSGLLELVDGTQLSDKQLAEMHGWNVTNAHLSSWEQRLEEFGVFFSAPLDLDFLMLTAYPDAYKALETGATGPNIPKHDATDYGPRLKSAIEAILKDAGGDGQTYGSEAQAEFFWYRYLFLGRGKPTTHLRALAALSGAQLKDKCPPVLGRLILRMQQSLNAPSTKTGNGTKS